MTFKHFLRWLWLKLYDEDIFVMFNQRKDLGRLNSVHCEFIEELKRNHPELKSELDKHQQDRFDSLHL